MEDFSDSLVPTQCSFVPAGDMRNIGSCYRSEQLLNSQSCIKLDLSKVEDQLDTSQCSDMCNPSTKCVVYKRPSNPSTVNPMFCMERIEITSSTFGWVFVDYARQSTNSTCSQVASIDTPDTLYNCVNGNCTLSALVSQPSPSPINTTIFVPNPSQQPTKYPTDPNDSKTATASANLFVYLMIPFILAIIIVPFAYMKLRRFSCRRTRPVVTKSAPVEIVYVDRRLLNAEFAYQQPEKVAFESEPLPRSRNPTDSTMFSSFSRNSMFLSSVQMDASSSPVISMYSEAPSSEVPRDVMDASTNAESTAIVYIEHPPAYLTALSDAIDRPGDQYQ